MPIATPGDLRRDARPGQGRCLRLPGHQLHLVPDHHSPPSRASPRRRATASSRSPWGGAEYASGQPVKDMVAGAVALAEFAHVVAEKYDVHDRPAHRPLPEGEARRLHAPAASTSSAERVKAGREPLFQSHMWDGSAVELGREPRRSPTSSSTSARPRRSSWSWRSASSAARRTASRPSTTRSSTRPPRTVSRRPRRSASASVGATWWRRRSATCTASTSRATSCCTPSILKDIQDAVGAKYGKDKPFDLVFHGGSGSLLSEIREALDYGVVKMNVDTDTQYAFTRPVADHMFKQLRRRAQGRRRRRQQEAVRPARLGQGGRGRHGRPRRRACNDLRSAGTRRPDARVRRGRRRLRGRSRPGRCGSARPRRSRRWRRRPDPGRAARAANPGWVRATRAPGRSPSTRRGAARRARGGTRTGVRVGLDHATALPRPGRPAPPRPRSRPGAPRRPRPGRRTRRPGRPRQAPPGSRVGGGPASRLSEVMAPSSRLVAGAGFPPRSRRPQPRRGPADEPSA